MENDKLKAIFTQAASRGWSADSTSQVLSDHRSAAIALLEQLQEWLERFSENVKSKADDTMTMLEQLSTHTNEVEGQLYNVFNSFKLLSNSQFIENRVYDEDETLGSSGVQAAQQPAVNEAAILPNETLKMALEAHQNVFKSSMFKAARCKRFPYVIGTEEFNRDPFCGLVEQTAAEDYDSEVEKDGINMAVQLVGTGQNISDAGSIGDATESEHDGEPAVSAALDFKSMLEAALRAPYIPYDAGTALNSSIYDHIGTLTGALDRERPGHKDEEGAVSSSPKTSVHAPKKQEVADLAEAVRRDATIPGTSRPTISDEVFLPFSSRSVPLTSGESSTASPSIESQTSSKIWDLLGSPKGASLHREQKFHGPAIGSEPVAAEVDHQNTAINDLLVQNPEGVPTDVHVSTQSSIEPAVAGSSEDETASWSSDTEDGDRSSAQNVSEKPPQASTSRDSSNIDADDEERATAETSLRLVFGSGLHKDLEAQKSRESLRTSNLSALLFGDAQE